MAIEMGQRPGQKVKNSGHRSAGFRDGIRKFCKIAAQKKIRTGQSLSIERFENLDFRQRVNRGFFGGDE